MKTSDATNEKLFGEEADSADLMNFARAFASLGFVVGQQLIELLRGVNPEELNSNAVEMIKERLGGFHQDIDDSIEEFEDFEDGVKVMGLPSDDAGDHLRDELRR